ASQSDGGFARGPHRPRVLRAPGATAPAIGIADLRKKLAAGEVAVVDLDLSKNYLKGHIPGAWFAVRARLDAALAKLPSVAAIVLTSADGALASVAASELVGAAKIPVLTLAGGTRNWESEGLPLTSGAERMLDVADDVYLMPRERGQDREAA